jgi:hypothetical protein
MKTDIISIAELQDYINSPEYKKSEILPISPERAKSYIENPRADGNMPILFTLSEKEKIIAYRTVLPDYFISNNSKIAFAWLSGNFVSNEYRRKGLSSALFRSVEESWKGKLMYTNYAPASKAVYDKSGQFQEIIVRAGNRYYLRSSLSTLFKERYKVPGLLELTDSIINSIHDRRLKSSSYSFEKDILISEIDSVDTELASLIESESKKSLFCRGIKEFDWIRKNPWIRSEDIDDNLGDYQFSWKKSRFANKWIKIESSEGLAFLWITIVEEKFAVPYFYYNHQSLLNIAKKLIINEMAREKCSFFSSRHPELLVELNSSKRPFIISKSMPQRYFAHKALIDLFPSILTIHDGDGDCVFT